jgi:Ca2+-binding RTX toxin-like protein
MGNDLIVGGAGNDVLFCGAGNDYLTGGTGSDLFVFGASANGNDVISDFSRNDGDKIAIDANGVLGIADTFTSASEGYHYTQAVSGNNLLVTLQYGVGNTTIGTVTLMGQSGLTLTDDDFRVI